MANTTFRSEVKWTGTGLQSDAQAGEHVESDSDPAAVEALIAQVESSCPVKDTLSGVPVERA